MVSYKRAIQPYEINVDTINKINLSEICQVCGEKNAKFSYGVQSCASCKIFFRRNAYLDLNKTKCIFGEECHITIKNRHTCRYCRLNKCLSVGMKKELLRASHGAQGGTKMKEKLLAEKIKSNEKKISSIIIIHPIDLLNNDRSLLTFDQWSLLSNINNAYNSRSPISNINNIISSQSIYPPKIRLKMANANFMDIIASMYAASEIFIKIIPDFSSMTNYYQNVLITRNILNLGGFNCQFMMRETNILKDAAYSNCLSSTYGTWIFNGTVRIADDIDPDGTLFKLLFVVLAFSACSDVVIPPYNKCDKISDYSVSDVLIETNYLSINTQYLFEIQNKYVELMFKYMVYRYGYYEAALRFAALMKNFLYQSVLSANATEISKHDDMLKTLVDKTEQLFIS
ncbi:unnamed protein product [Rotaria sp. Silwood2]|nr:unnamed protein product [Rotaria sp. Silwood2]